MTKMKFSVTALFLLLLLIAGPLTASAPLPASAAVSSDTIKVQSMNVKMIFDGDSLQPPSGLHVFIYNNTTYVPIRFVSYALQKSVAWDAKNLKVTIAEPSSSEQVVINEYLMNAKNATATVATKNIVLSKVKASYVFNGSVEAVPTGQASYMLNGSLYVPLRFLSESVGKTISWNQKTRTITAITSTDHFGNGSEPSPTPTPVQTNSPNSRGGSSAGNDKVSYESITSDTEAKLSALKAQSQSTLMSIALEYIAAKDAASKQSIKAKGIQQLSSFTASFNSIISSAEQQLISNGYSTDIIQEYRSTFEAELQAGKDIAEGMAD